MVKVIRDKKSGRFQGSVGKGKTSTPTPAVLVASPKSKIATLDELEKHHDFFIEQHPNWTAFEIGLDISDKEYFLSSGKIPSYASKPLKRLIFWYDSRVYKLAKTGNHKTIERFLRKFNPNAPSNSVELGLIMNKNLTEDHLLVLASLLRDYYWTSLFVRHPAAGERLLLPVVDTSDPQTIKPNEQLAVAQRDNLPLSVQLKLVENDDPMVREAFLNNPTVEDNLKTLAALSYVYPEPNFSDSSNHRYKFPIPERFKKVVQKRR